MTYEEIRRRFCEDITAFNNGEIDATILYEKAVRLGEESIIEKACDAYCKVCGHYHHTVPTHICRQDCDYYMRFRKAMEQNMED